MENTIDLVSKLSHDKIFDLVECQTITLVVVRKNCTYEHIFHINVLVVNQFLSTWLETNWLVFETTKSKILEV